MPTDVTRRRALAAAGSSLFFALAPGMVAGVVPWWLTGWRARDPLPYWAPLRVAGVVVLVAGAAVLVHAFARFVVEGVGTPAPAAPTEHLVVGGLYRFVRNPMYVAVLAVLVGQVLLFRDSWLVGYTVVIGIVVNAFVHGYEEPTLRDAYGPAYDEFCAAVPRWLPRLTPWPRPASGPGA
jgi:protein-S-isoprenylcysteine O-methyltransferase Ste14